MKNLFSITTILIVLVLSGCSRKEPETEVFFNEEQQAKMKAIADKHLTDEDWIRYQQEFDHLMEGVSNEYSINLRDEYNKNLLGLFALMRVCKDKPKFSSELFRYLDKDLDMLKWTNQVNEEFDE